MRCAALLVAVALQAGFCWWLLHCTPMVPIAPESTDQVLRVVFVERRLAAMPTDAPPMDAPSGATAAPSATTSAARPGRSGVTPAAAAAPAGGNGGVVDGALDLSLPEAMTVVEIGRDGPFDRPQALDPATTRFARRWKPQADVITEFAWDHPMVAAALAALGGGPPPPTCSELDRRREKPGCPPLFVQGLQDAAAVFNTARPRLLQPPPGEP